MVTYSPLFITSPARAGSTLLAHVLNSHPYAAVDSDSYFPLYRSFRNAILQQAEATSERPLAWHADQPMQDYYFTDDRIQVMDCGRIPVVLRFHRNGSCVIIISGRAIKAATFILRVLPAQKGIHTRVMMAERT